jgi:hypothetical protein
MQEKNLNITQFVKGIRFRTPENIDYDKIRLEHKFCGTSGHRVIHSKWRLEEGIEKLIKFIKDNDDVDSLLNGAALESDGWDRLTMDAAMGEDIPIGLCLPMRFRAYHRELRKYVKYAHETSGLLAYAFKYHDPFAYFKRNQMLVLCSRYLLVYWNGTLKGGTYYTRNYAIMKNFGRRIINCCPR